MPKNSIILNIALVLLLVFSVTIGFLTIKLHKKSVLGASTYTPQPTPTVKVKDMRITNVENFLGRYKSVLYSYAPLIVEQADANQIDYRLIPGIAFTESTLCKKIIPESYNCWGWGIYGDTVTRFDDYEDAIKTISRGLKKYYYDRGLATPEAIMTRYTPSSPGGAWARTTGWAMKKIEDVEYNKKP